MTWLIALFLLASPAAAVTPAEMLDDPVLEARARDLGQALRCVVCQNESIDASNAPLAQDMRRVVRSLLLDGRSDTEIMNFMVERYGDFVLLKPPVKPVTWGLWFGPAAIFLIGGFAVYRVMRRPRASEDNAP